MHVRNHFLQAIIASVGLALIPPGAFAAQPGTTADSRVNETAKTAAAVVAVDEHWARAEENGDGAWLDGMLMPDYRSVGSGGTFASKAAIVGHAAARRYSQAMRQKASEWHRQHPVEKKVTLHGDTAILSFLSASPETLGKIYSSDIFIYVDGHWRALYSQHNAVGKG